MTSRPYTVLMALIGAVCLYALARLLFFDQARSLATYRVQGILIGYGLGLVTAQVLGRIRTKKFNGWITMMRCGVPGNGMFMRAACAMMFLGPVNVPQEERAAGGHVLDDVRRWRATHPHWRARLRHALSRRRAATA